MARQERQSQILSLIEEKKFVTVRELQRQLYVSLPTVRRDLAQMERLGLIQRRHGGAGLMPKGYSNRPSMDRIQRSDSRSQAVAQVLTDLLRDDCVVFADTSAHEQAVCDALLGHKNLMVVTNSPTLPPRLQQMSGSVHCLGGLYNRSSHAVAGEIAETAVEQYNFDFAIIAGAAINPRGDITCGSMRVAALLRRAMRQAQCSVILSVGGGTDGRNICNAGTITPSDYLITDRPPILSDPAVRVIRI